MSRSSPGSPLRLVCKVGGSLLDGGWAPPLVDALRRTAPGPGILAMAGGGRAADRVRLRHRRGALDLSEAHWAAIRVLDVNALRLAGGCGASVPVVAGVAGLATAGTSLRPAGRSAGARSGGADPGERHRGLTVLAPSALLRAEDPLPHGRDVTSDSIAAWVAGRVGASRLLLLKARGDRSGPGSGAGGSYDAGAVALPAPAAARDGLVDAHLSALLEDAPYGAWILNGRHPDRLLSFLTGDPSAALRLSA